MCLLLFLRQCCNYGILIKFLSLFTISCLIFSRNSTYKLPIFSPIAANWREKSQNYSPFLASFPIWTTPEKNISKCLFFLFMWNSPNNINSLFAITPWITSYIFIINTRVVLIINNNVDPFSLYNNIIFFSNTVKLLKICHSFENWM